MEMHQVSPGVIAFIHPEGRSNCGMIHTTEGVVLVDTTAARRTFRLTWRWRGFPLRMSA